MGYECRVWGMSVESMGYEWYGMGYECRVWGMSVRVWVWGYECRVWVLGCGYGV